MLSEGLKRIQSSSPLLWVVLVVLFTVGYLVEVSFSVIRFALPHTCSHVGRVDGGQRFATALLSDDVVSASVLVRSQ